MSHRRQTDRPLTPKQERFAEEYVIDLNATDAYRRAGYTCKTDTVARVESCRLLAKPSVARAIQSVMSQRSHRTQLSADDVLRELAVVGRSSVSDFVVDASGRLTTAPGVPPEAIRAVSGVKRRVRTVGRATVVEVEFRLWDKPAALSMMARHLGMLPRDGSTTNVNVAVGANEEPGSIVITKEMADRMPAELLDALVNFAKGEECVPPPKQIECHIADGSVGADDR
jgi:phage terminase small subunit